MRANGANDMMSARGDDEADPMRLERTAHVLLRTTDDEHIVACISLGDRKAPDEPLNPGESVGADRVKYAQRCLG
jgi:hypothetical protein